MTCPTCGQPTLNTPNGHLNPTPGRLGLHARDGITLTPDEIRDPHIRGYYPHHCPPQSTTTKRPSSQDTLF